MFLCFIEYLYGILYYVIHKLPDRYMQGILLTVRDRVFSDKIMFFTGILAFIGLVFAILNLIFGKGRKKTLIIVLLQAAYFYVYMTFFLEMPVFKIFSFLSKVWGYIQLLFK